MLIINSIANVTAAFPLLIKPNYLLYQMSTETFCYYKTFFLISREAYHVIRHTFVPVCERRNKIILLMTWFLMRRRSHSMPAPSIVSHVWRFARKCYTTLPSILLYTNSIYILYFIFISLIVSIPVVSTTGKGSKRERETHSWATSSCQFALWCLLGFFPSGREKTQLHACCCCFCSFILSGLFWEIKNKAHCLRRS